MILTPEQQIIRQRQQAYALATCPGWLLWALPMLANKMAMLETAILTDDSLEGNALLKKRAAHKALSEFLGDLKAIAQGSFATITPDSPAAFNLGPDQVADMVSNAFTTTGRSSPSPAPETFTHPPAENDLGTSFSPFAGIPQPPVKTPPPSQQ